MHALCMVHLTMHTILDIPHNNYKFCFIKGLYFPHAIACFTVELFKPELLKPVFVLN